MSNITIKEVSSKSELNDFIKLPWKIYKDYKYWVPPLLMDVKNTLNKEKNPFFKHGTMDYFLAYKDGELVGRIAAVVNDLHNEIHNDKVGFFGFFESINDKEVAAKLLETAKEWLVKKGFDQMRGPANPSSNDPWAALLEGYDDEPRLLMPYNPKYYHELFESFGLKKVKDLYAFKIERSELLKSEKLLRVSELAAKRYKFTVRSLNLKDFQNELGIVKFLYNKVWENNWGFVPMTDDEINHMAKDLKPLVDPNLVLFGEVDGKPVGFALVVPDYNYVFKKMNGKLLPFGWLTLLRERKNIPWARIITLGLLPEFQQKGLDAVFYKEVVDRANERGITLGEASWVLEDNQMMVRGSAAMNGTLYKKYRVYEMPTK